MIAALVLAGPVIVLSVLAFGPVIIEELEAWRARKGR